MSLQLSLFGDQNRSGFVEPDGWRVRVSKRARHLSIQVYSHGGIEIVAPRRASAREIEEFVRTQRNWIEQSRLAMMVPGAVREPALPEQIDLPAVGQTFDVVYQRAEQSSYRCHGSQLQVFSPDKNTETCWPILRRWLAAAGRRELRPWLFRFGRTLNMAPRRVQIRLQRSRWGSCSSSGTICLNAAALMLPPAQVEYLIAHELCHLRHMNHSRRYWRLLQQHVPDCRQLDAAVGRAWDRLPFWVVY